MDLPSELRNHVYDYIFEEPASYDLKLLAPSTWEACPSAMITLASKQIRNESLKIFQRAVTNFFANHCVHLDDLEGLSYLNKKRAYYSELDHLPDDITIRKVEFRSRDYDYRFARFAGISIKSTVSVLKSGYISWDVRFAPVNSIGPAWTRLLEKQLRASLQVRSCYLNDNPRDFEERQAFPKEVLKKVVAVWARAVDYEYQ